ncbi:MAG: hypothetical protein GY862_35525 [Gammaproteobacteria bacterium]|nr:hypothetical protein [Gammaproteobacteria bacterium]
MSDEIIETQAADPSDIALLQKYAEETVKQSERLDELAKQLFTLELAIPGIYATILKLVAGKNAVLANTPLLWVSFILWSFALIFTLIGVLPRRYKVMRDTVRRENTRNPGGQLSVEEFYQKSTDYKYRALVSASVCFFGGILCVAFSIFL